MSPSLDHIIILLPHSVLKELPLFFTSNFSIYPGGTHADGKTTNSLILLKSGVYLELISFVDDLPENKEGHWWGSKTPGTIVDWALTSPSVDDVEAIRSKLKDLNLEGLQGEINYLPPKKGGRKRPDGEEVKWEVRFPTPSIARGTIPFWCHDVTPRELRVPITTAEKATYHPTHAIGISDITIVVHPDHWGAVSKFYAAILGHEEIIPGLKHNGIGYAVAQPTPGSERAGVNLRKAEGEEMMEAVRANGGVAGIWGITLAVEGNSVAPDEEEKIGEGVIRIGFEKVRT